MADRFRSHLFERFTMVMREPQFMRTDERASFAYAACRSCGEKIRVDDESAREFLQHLDDHRCPPSEGWRLGDRVEWSARCYATVIDTSPPGSPDLVTIQFDHPLFGISVGRVPRRVLSRLRPV